MDSQSKPSTSLPSIAALDFGLVKREDNETMRKPAPISTTINPSSYSQPTPPHSHPPSMSSLYSPGLASPPGSRRPSKEESAIVRRSLPSIQEALGSSRFSVSSSSTIVSPVSSSANPPRSFLESAIVTDTQRSIGPSTDRRYEPESATETRRYTSSLTDRRYESETTTDASRYPGPSSDTQRYIGPPSDRRYEPEVPTRSAYSASSVSSQPYVSAYELKPLLSASTAHSNGSSYQRSLPPSTYSSQWRSEAPVESQFSKSGRSIHEDAIKHHIQNLDLTNAELDASLREVEDKGIQMLEFSRYYNAQRKQNQHLGPLLNAVPSLIEVDTLIARSHRLQENLTHLKGLVEAHHMAVRESAQQKAPLKRPLEPENHADSGYQFQEDGQGDSPGNGAPRKRRGRAAPPGRCHSCNRNETPEWRRGPDGARTLCNACGLHYAKLTRKMNSNGTKSSAGSSLNPATASAQTPREE